MAQTIGMSRGNSSVYGNGSSLTQFYTQSGGSATRVIINALAGWGQQTAYNYPGTLALVYSPSGGSPVIVGWATRNGYAGHVQFLSAGAGPSGALAGNASGTVPIQGVIAGTGSSAPGNNALGNYTYFTWGSNNYSWHPQNLWMGPGDSLGMKAYWSAYAGKYGSQPVTVSFTWSLTIITES